MTIMQIIQYNLMAFLGRGVCAIAISGTMSMDNSASWCCCDNFRYIGAILTNLIMERLERSSTARHA